VNGAGGMSNSQNGPVAKAESILRTFTNRSKTFDYDDTLSR
jgi:hypothetical protein